GGGVTVEGLRARWPYAFPWGRLAMSQSVAPDVRWVAIGGAPFLSFLVALTGAMIARAALGFLGGFRNGRPRTTWGAALAAAVPAGLVLAGGAVAVATIGRPGLDGGVLKPPLRNAGQLWVPGRGPTTIYVKRGRVPFGEYIPF